MVLTGLKSCRLDKGYSLRELAKRSGVDFTTIDRLERGRAAQERTAHKLAAALEVAPAALYAVEQPEPTSRNIQTPTISVVSPARTRARKIKLTGLWVGVEAGHVYLARDQEAADHLKEQFGRVRVYRVADWKEAAETHRAFLTRVAGGRDAW
jgi:transcriptional regulator with XRE-family HTH domain